MTYPLMVLAACAVLVGLIFGPTKLFEHHLEHTYGFHELHHGEHAFDFPTALISTIAGLAGIALAYLLYGKPSEIPGRISSAVRPLYNASLNKFYVDEIYDWLIVKTTKVAAILSEFLDTYLLNGLVMAVALAPRRLARSVLANYQNGLLQFYAGASAVAMAILLFILLLF